MSDFELKKYVPARPPALTPAERKYLEQHPRARYVPALSPQRDADEIARRAKNGNSRYVPAGPAPTVDFYPVGPIDTTPNTKPQNFLPTQWVGTSEPWWHRAIFESQTLGNVVVYYYVPQRLDSTKGSAGGGSVAQQGAPGSGARPRRFVVGIPGAGAEHYRGGAVHIQNMGLIDINYDNLDSQNPLIGKSFADLNNTIIIVPCFDQWYGPLKLGSDPPAYLPYRPWWVAQGSQEDCAFLFEFLNYPPVVFQDRVADFQFNLTDFYQTVGWLDPYRSDLVLNNIIDQFQQAFAAAGDPVEETFMIYGHSGGAQFVSHYMLMWPERLAGAALSSAGHVLMPRTDYRFPFGMDVFIKDGALYGDHGAIWPIGDNSDPNGDKFPTTDLTLLTDFAANPGLWYEKIRDACKFPKIMTVGLDEGADPSLRDTGYGALQGADPVDKAYNYFLEINRAIVIARGAYGADWPPDAIHDNMAFFQFNVEHGDNLTDTWNWLKHYWLDYPSIIPYRMTDYSQTPPLVQWMPRPDGPDSPPGNP